MCQESFKYPLIDLFAGPGGLGEGFSMLCSDNVPTFSSIASIERDEFSYQTLLLRHFFKAFKTDAVPDDYYAYLQGGVSKQTLKDRYPQQWSRAEQSALKLNLGPDNHDRVKGLIKNRLGTAKKWALIGGPPCQAYSLVGRSRMMGNPEFEDDERHFLYKEYLKIIVDHRPPVFVMENVKGLLSAKHNGEFVINKIIDDLSSPIQAIDDRGNELTYRLYSLSGHGEISNKVDRREFIVKAEHYGVPQARHRMFILGVRADITVEPGSLVKKDPPTVEEVLSGLPKIRSGLSRQKDSGDLWKDKVTLVDTLGWTLSDRQKDSKIKQSLADVIDSIKVSNLSKSSREYSPPHAMREWYQDERLMVLLNHEARSHMVGDLQRYMYAAAYAEVFSTSPKLAEFPDELLPAHKNVQAGRDGKMFSDRFRVQVKSRVSTTITSHISKDGHYFIHYDPSQCRSLTVREAARLQTFPDNYYFEGPRTSQYHQVGNAVPPFLAMQIAKIVKEVLDEMQEQ